MIPPGAGGGVGGIERNRDRLGIEDGGWRGKVASMGDGDDSEASDEEIRFRSMMRSIFGRNPPSERDSPHLLYNIYLVPLEGHLKTKILPTLKGEEGESLLRQIVSSWNQHKRAATLLSRLFNHYDISQNAFLRLSALGLSFFYNQVFNDIKEQVTATVLKMIDHERDGHPVDCILLKNVLAVYSEVHFGDMDAYNVDFEMAFSKNSSEYYSQKAKSWILKDSWHQYILKADQCLQNEEQRIQHFLPASSQQELIKIIQFELVSRNTEQILQKLENSGFEGFPCDQVDNLARIFRFFSTMDANLVLVPKIFKELVIEHLTSLVKQAINATCCIKNDREVQLWLLQNYIQKAAELHEKYVECVKCFPRQAVFYKILEDTFQSVSNQDIAGYTSAELFASFFAHILRKYGSENDLCEAIEATLEKAMKLLPYMTNKVLFVRIYREKLGRRLFLYKNMCDTHETAFLCKLKSYLGCQYSTLIEEVKNDILLARQQKAAGSLLGGAITGPTVSIGVQSLDLYLTTVRRVHTDQATGLSSNRIVEEFFVPGMGKKKMAKYTDEGYSIFGGLAGQVTNAHESGKSWDGKLKSNMFFQYQGQIYLFPWAIPKLNCSSDTASNDFQALGSMCLTESSLRTPAGIVYPLHLQSLCANLKKLPRGSALGRKIGTYVRCNPAFLRHSQRSCLSWHLRRYDLSKDSTIRSRFRTMLDKITSVKKQWFKDLEQNPLFKSTFVEARKRGMSYEEGAYGLYRFLRDWHTHCHQRIAAMLKGRYPFEIMEFVAELLFGHYLSDILYALLTDQADIDVWLSELHPKLPVQNYKGDC